MNKENCNEPIPILTIETNDFLINLSKYSDYFIGDCYFKVSPNLKQNKQIEVVPNIFLTAKQLRKKPLFRVYLRKKSVYCEKYDRRYCSLIHNIRLILLDLLKWHEYW